MNWLRALLRREDHDRAQRKLAALAVKSDATLARVNRLLAERDRLRDAVRNTAAVLAEGRR